MNAWVWIGVAALGAAGALLRFFVDGVISSRLGGELPLGTLAVNLSGAVVLGLVVGVALPRDDYVLAGTATIGSYTTFSTWMLETQRLVEAGETRWAAVNGLFSLGLGLGAAAVGRLIGSHL
jgi:fluoride exporter